MNRTQTEKLIAGLLKQIVEIYHVYDPDADYLHLCYLKCDDGTNRISFDNCAHKAENPIDHHETI